MAVDYKKLFITHYINLSTNPVAITAIITTANPGMTAISPFSENFLFFTLYSTVPIRSDRLTAIAIRRHSLMANDNMLPGVAKAMQIFPNKRKISLSPSPQILNSLKRRYILAWASRKQIISAFV